MYAKSRPSLLPTIFVQLFLKLGFDGNQSGRRINHEIDSKDFFIKIKTDFVSPHCELNTIQF